MSGTNQNFNSRQRAAHVAAQKAAQCRVTPILDKQAKSAPKTKP